MTLHLRLDDIAPVYVESTSAKKDKDAPKVDTLSTIIPVQLAAEDMKAFVTAFHPKRAAKAPHAFLEAARFMAEVSAYLDSIFAGLRYGMSLSLSMGDKVDASALGDGITRDIGVAYNGAAELDKKSKDFLMSMAQGSHHIIKDSTRYKGGKDILYVGLRGANVSPLLSSAMPQTIQLPLLQNSYAYDANKSHYETAPAKALVETGLLIQRLLFGGSIDKLSSAYTRVNNQHEVGGGANLIQSLQAIFIKGPLAKLGIPVMLPAFKGIVSEHLMHRLPAYTSFFMVREPVHQIVLTRSRNKDLPDESLGICQEAVALMPDIRFSFAVNLPKNFCEYITQTKDEPIPLVPLNTWASVWSAAMLRPPKTRSSAADRAQRSQGTRVLVPERAPKYVLRPSASDALIARRKELGLYSEQGRVNDDGLFITYNGDLGFLNSAEDSAAPNAKAYEKLAEEALSLSFDAGTPLAAGQRGSTGIVFDLASPNYAEKIAHLKDSLGKYKGSVQAINWDLNSILTVSVADPDRLVATKLTGGAKPEPLNLATYLRQPFNKGMMSMFSRTRVSDAEGRKFRVSKDAFSDAAISAIHCSVFTNFAHLYNHLLKLTKVPTLKELVDKAAANFKIANLEDPSVAEYEVLALDSNRTIYKQIISKDLTVFDPGERTGQAILALLGVAATQAAAKPGTNLMRLCLRDNIEFTEHDRYFDGMRSPVGDFARLYTWLGGEVFHIAVQAVLDLPRKELLEIHDVPLNPEDPEDGHPGFLSIVNEVMPMCVMLGKYTTPDIRDKIYKDADAIKERESELTEHDLNLAGSRGKDANGKGGMKLFPHQAEALVALKAHPKIAVLDIAPGGGKCLAPESLVPTKDGLFTLGELWGLSSPVAGRSDIRTIGVKVSTIAGNKPTDGTYSTRGKTRRVLLKDGTEFIGLPEHRMYALDQHGRMDFVRLDNLLPGMYMPKAVGTRLFAKKAPQFEKFDLSKFHINTRNSCANVRLPARLTVDFAQLLGLLVAEGYTPKGSDAVNFTNHDQAVLNFYFNVLQREFGIKQPCQQDTHGKNVGIRLHNAYVGAFFSSVLSRGLSAEKQVPLCVRAAPEEHQCAFLRGLFEGDGTIGNGVRSRISYCSASKQLAYQVKAMLENIGIYCSVKESIKSATNGHAGNATTVYSVRLWEHTSNVQMFAEKIGFMSDRKQSRLEARLAHIASLSGGQNTNQFAHGPYNKVPCLPEYTALIALVEDLLSQTTYSVAFGNQSRTVRLSLDKVLADFGMRRKAITAKAGVVTRYNIDTLFSVLDDLGRDLAYVRRDAGVAQLRQAIQALADHIWVPVVGNEAGKTIQVYDLSVPSNHTYVVNGYLGHNTTIGIADIACLYADGLIKRPFVFAPNRLVRNWIEDCHKSFAGWNTIPVTTETYAEWGEERLTKMILEAPPNTIVIVGNSFISNTEKTQLVIGNAVDNMSNSVEFCKKFQPDYIIIDESHRIRNPRSAIHQGIKTVMQMSSVKYGRIATGTLIQNVLSDVVGQSAVFNGQIFRTLDEFDEENKGVVAIVNDKKIIDYMDDTPLKARRRLAEFATVISFKKKEWAFMLPIPIERFITVDMETMTDPNNPDNKIPDELGHKLQLFYNSVLNRTLKEMRDDPKISKKKKKDEDESDDGEGDDDGPGGNGATQHVTSSNGAQIEVTDQDDDSDQDDELEQALQPYLQRLERLLTDPFGDTDLIDVAKEIFGQDYDEDFARTYATPKVAKVIERIKLHFAENPWQKGKLYSASDMVDFNGKTFIFKSDLPAGHGEERSDMAPDSDPNWKPQIRGKVFVACRYTRSVDAIFRALPADLRDKTVRFHGDVDNKDDNLARFQNDPKIQILIGNEMGISEGHNFQMASRFIRVEAPWAPGELDQTASRIFRPDVGGEYARQTIFLDWILCDNTLEIAKMGRLISKMLKRTKFDELDNPKYYKDLNPANLPIIKMSLENIQMLYKFNDLCSLFGDGSSGDIHPHSYIGQYRYLVSETGQEFREMRATKRAYMMDVEPTKMPDTAKTIDFVPWVPNQRVEDRDNDGLLPLKATMEDEDNELAKAFRKDHRALIGQFVRTEFGVGVIDKVTTKRGSSSDEGGEDDAGNEISKVRVKLSQGGNVEMLSASKVFLATNITERNKTKYNKKAPQITEADKKRTAKNLEKAEKVVARVKAKTQATKEALRKQAAKPVKAPPPPKAKDTGKTVTLYPVIYNEFLALEGFEDDADSKLLKRHGFTRFAEYAYLPIKTAQAFNAALDFLEDRYTISPKTVAYLDMLADSFQSGKGRKFDVQLAPVADFPQFYRMRHTLTVIKNKRKPELKLYPVLLNGNLMLVVDLTTNPVFRKQLGKTIPGLTGTNKFQEAEGMDIHFFRSKADLIAKVKELRAAGFTITNLNEIKEETAKLSLKTLTRGA